MTLFLLIACFAFAVYAGVRLVRASTALDDWEASVREEYRQITGEET